MDRIVEIVEPGGVVLDPFAGSGTTGAASLSRGLRFVGVERDAHYAKVARDRLMRSLGTRRPGYGWESNMGYGSAGHMSALRTIGMTPHHRKLFCRGILEQGEMFG